MSFANDSVSISAQIGKAFHEAYKLNTSADEYAYMSSRAISAHNGNSFESILIKCAEIALKGEDYTKVDIQAVLALAASMKANDQTLFEKHAEPNSKHAAMQIHADMLNCAMP